MGPPPGPNRVGRVGRRRRKGVGACPPPRRTELSGLCADVVGIRNLRPLLPGLDKDEVADCHAQAPGRGPGLVLAMTRGEKCVRPTLPW